MNMHPPHCPKYRIRGSAHFRPMPLLATAITNVVTCGTYRALVARLVAKITLLVFRTVSGAVFVVVAVVVVGVVVVVVAVVVVVVVVAGAVVVVAKFVLITCSC